MTGRVAPWLLLMGLGLAPAWAQEPQMGQLGQALNQALQQMPGVPPEDQVLGARFELLQAQRESLLRGQGDWDTFFRFYQVTQQQAVRHSPLPSALVGPWNQIQSLMAEIAPRHGRQAPPLASPTGPLAARPPSQLSPPQVSQALAALQEIEGNVSGPPPGCDVTRFQQARADLTALRQSLQSGNPSRIVRDRRRVQLSRSALQLPESRFWALDQSLDQIPVP